MIIGVNSIIPIICKYFRIEMENDIGNNVFSIDFDYTHILCLCEKCEQLNSNDTNDICGQFSHHHHHHKKMVIISFWNQGSLTSGFLTLCFDYMWIQLN